MTKTQRRARMCLFALFVLTLGFIWWNSLQSGLESSNLSGSFGAFLERLLGFPIDSFLLRKLAHFSEYGLLGAEAAAAERLTPGRGAFGALSGRNLLETPLLGLLAAVIDETLQLFSEGRAAAVPDVWIDTAGFCTGFFGLLLLLFLCRSVFRRKRGTHA